MSVGLGLVAAFLEGVLAFVSPCLLPLLPVYVAFFSGDVPGRPVDGGDGVGTDGADLLRGATIARSLAFVAGFALPFTALGAFAGTLGSLLVRHRRLLDVACGGLVMLLGLNYLGVVRIRLLSRTRGLTRRPQSGGLAGAFLLGVTFAVGWTPCVGTFLASALGLAATSGGSAQGVTMLMAFSVGLGLPFVLCALLIDQLEGTLAWMRARYGLVERASGMVLVVFGLLMALGLSGTWAGLVS